jgi:hypothetical protein
MDRAFDRELKWDPDTGVDYDLIPQDPKFKEWLDRETRGTNTEPCSDCYDEDSEIPKFALKKENK